MTRRILHQTLHLARFRAVLPLDDDSGLVCPLRENARAGLVAVSDADLEGVVVKRGGGGAAVKLLLEDVKQGVTICETIFRPTHHAGGITDCVVQTLDLNAAGITVLDLGKWE